MTTLVESWAGGIEPPPPYDPASWAEARRILTSAETGEPGRWRNDRTPPAIEPMQRLAMHDPTPRVVLMFCAQYVKSEVCNNLIGYVADWCPAPMLMLRPTIDDAEGFSKQRLRHLFASPTLAGKVKEPRSRDSGNTLMLKEFPGGLLVLAGANAPSRLASWPIRVLIADEVDRYPESAGTEGDPLQLARARLTSFGDRAKELLTSTPTIKHRSRIESEYLASSQGRYHVPCPHCGDHQPLEWALLRWDGDPTDGPFRVWYKCAACHGQIEEHQKTVMLRDGAWVHAHPDRTTKGYHINALYQPVGRISWRTLIAEWNAANARAKVGDTTLLQVFVNTRLAETWEDRGEVVDATALEHRGEKWDAVPAGVQAITIGVDTQDDRLEAEVVGWSGGMESWSLGHFVIPTDPLDRGTWAALDDIVMRTWTTEDGRNLRAAAVCVDSGFRTQAVYDYCRARTRMRVFAIKGLGGAGKPVWDRKVRRGGRNKNEGRFHGVGVDAAKDAVAAYLRVTAPGPGYCHFPVGRDPSWFAQLTAEKRIKVRDRKGREHWEWHVIAGGRRNEALDCRVYALAALHSLLVSGLKMETPRTASREHLPQPVPPKPASLTGTNARPDPAGRVPKRVPVRQGWSEQPRRGGIW